MAIKVVRKSEHIKEENEDETPIETLLKLASSENCKILPLKTTKMDSQIESPSQQTPITKSQSQNPSSFSSFTTHFHRQLVLTFFASYRLQLLYILLYILNYLLVSRIFSSSSAGAAGCVSINSNSSSCELSFEEEIDFKENAFNLCYTVLYVGLLTIYRSTAVFTDQVQVFKAEFRNGKSGFFVLHLRISFYLRLVFLARILRLHRLGRPSRGVSFHWNYFPFGLLCHRTALGGRLYSEWRPF